MQFSLCGLRPGLFSTPYVETNNNPSRYPTGVLHGEYEVSLTAALAADSVIIVNNPFAGYDLNQGLAGVLVLTRDNATPFNVGIGTGVGFNSVYGDMAMTSRYRVYGQTLDVSILAPSSTISGVAYIGSLPVSVVNGITVPPLRDMCTEIVDLKENPTFSLKTFINDRTLVHGSRGNSDIADEYISFAILSRSAVQTIVADGSKGFVVAIKAHANFIWEPVLASPFMASLTMRPPDNVRALTQAEQTFCNSCTASIPVPTPHSLQEVVAAMRSVTQGRPVSIRSRPPVTTVHPVPVSRALTDPAHLLPDHSSSLSLLTLFLTLLRNSDMPDEHKDRIYEVVASTLSKVRVSDAAIQVLRRRLFASPLQLLSHRDHDEIKYCDVPDLLTLCSAPSLLSDSVQEA